MITLYLVTHNYSRFLRDSLGSISRQLRKPDQLILIDNGSTDGVDQFFNPWKGRADVTVIYNANIGHIAAANQALALATGKYMIRLDGDDTFLPDALLLLERALDANPTAVCACGNYFLAGADGTLLHEIDATTRTSVVRTEKAASENSDRLNITSRVLELGSTISPPHGAVTLIRTAALREIGGYDESIKKGDGDYLAHRFCGKPFVHVQHPVFLYRQHDSNLTGR